MKIKNTKDNDELLGTQEAPLTEEELKILASAQKGKLDRSTLPPQDNSDMAKAKRYVKKNKFSVLFVVITIVLLISVLGSLIAMLFITNRGKPSTNDFSVTLGKEEFTIPYKTAMKDDVFYFDMRIIAEYTGLIVSGSEGRLKFSSPDNETYVRFENDGETATVNGTRVLLGGKAKITSKTSKSDGECLVPFTFIQKLFSNKVMGDSPSVVVKWSTKDNSVIIRRVVIKETNEPLEIKFSADCFDMADDIQMKYYEDLYPELTFCCQKMTVLVNKNNPLGTDYSPEGLISLAETSCPTVEGREFLLVSNAARSLEVMLNDLNEYLGGKEKIIVTSAYRSYDYQVKIFDKYVTDYMAAKSVTREVAEEYVLKTSAKPGQSEHQSGLCVDLIEYGTINLDERFGETAAFEWLSQNAFKYGFILRYPSGKEALTGYSYEPWHYRFVGIDAATVIHEDNICLEEYLAKY